MARRTLSRASSAQLRIDGVSRTFGDRRVLTDVSLVVGQQRRLALAIPPDLLLLDEPTNHLSLALAEELEEALGTHPGAVVLASHDRWLRRRWPAPVLLLG